MYYCQIDRRLLSAVVSSGRRTRRHAAGPSRRRARTMAADDALRDADKDNPCVRARLSPHSAVDSGIDSGQPPPPTCFSPSPRSRTLADFPASRACRGGAHLPPPTGTHLTDTSNPVPNPATPRASLRALLLFGVDIVHENKRSVVRRIPVFFNRARAADQTLCVLQYPLRPAERPYDIQHVDAVRYKPKSGKLEIDLPRDKGEAANPRNVDPEAAPNLRTDRRVLTSTETPVREGYCAAAMRDGALHLTPVDAAFQMRPSLAHLDAADDRRKQEDAGGGEKTRGEEKRAERDSARRLRADDDDGRVGDISGARGDAREGEESARVKNEHDAMLGGVGGVGDAAAAAGVSATDPPPSLVPLQVHVKRRETERQTEMRLHSHAYLKQLEEDEQWSSLTPVPDTHPYAVAARERVVTVARGLEGEAAPAERRVAGGAAAAKGEKGKGSAGGVPTLPEAPPAGIPITAASYLDAVCPIASDRLLGVDGDGGDGGAAARGDGSGNVSGNTSETRGLSKAQLESLPLAQRVHALFARGQRTVLRFSRVMHFAPAGSDPEEVLAALAGVAHLVQGCWVACSALRCGGDARRERVRDHALLHFSRAREMRADAFGRGPTPAPPPGELGLERLRREVLAELAVAAPGRGGKGAGAKSAGASPGSAEDASSGWTFAEATDHEFIARYPELVRRENERWRTLAPWLEADADVAASLAPPPKPPGVTDSAASAARALILPTIAAEGVARLSSVRARLERSGDPELAPLSLLREPELLGVLGPNVVSVDGACALRSIGDPAVDPFRDFLLKLLRRRSRAVRRTDVMEGAAAALGVAPSNAVYMRCLSDLCVSRGSTWVMKTGASP